MRWIQKERYSTGSSPRYVARAPVNDQDGLHRSPDRKRHFLVTMAYTEAVDAGLLPERFPPAPGRADQFLPVLFSSHLLPPLVDAFAARVEFRAST